MAEAPRPDPHTAPPTAAPAPVAAPAVPPQAKGPSAPAGFFGPGAGSARRAAGVLYAGTGAAALIYLYLAFFVPGTMRPDPWAIQDDARQFLLWMPRLIDPGLLRGDLMADYWQSVSPWLYRLPFEAAAALGVEPRWLGRVLAVPLLFLTAFAAWRLARTLTGDRPRVAFVAAAFLMGFVIHEDSIYTATPRAFSHPLLLLFFYALAAERRGLMLVVLPLLAAFYPAPAIVGVAMLGLSRVRGVWPVRLDLSRSSVALVVAAAGLTVAVLLPFALQTGPWGPALTLEQAKTMPTMMTPMGRSSIVDAGGHIGWLCSWRMGYIPALVPCNGWVPGATLWNFLLFVPLLWIAAGRMPGAGVRAPRLYRLALAAGAIGYALAALVAFRLHLPSRYSQRVLELLEWLAIGQMIGLWLEARLAVPFPGRGVRGTGGGVALFLTLSFLSPVPNIQRPADPALVRFVAGLPRGTRIGGVSEDLDFLPALTGRAVLAAPEQAIPYQLGYYRAIAARLRDSLTAVSTADPRRFAAVQARSPVDYLLVERAMLRTGAVPGRYADILPGESAAAGHALRAAPSLAVRGMAACARYRTAERALLDTRCLMRLFPATARRR